MAKRVEEISKVIFKYSNLLVELIQTIKQMSSKNVIVAKDIVEYG